MRVLRDLLVLSLLVGVTPGLGELVEDGAHLLREGHLAHGDDHGEHADGAEHDAPGPEHGCTGLHHTCPCHASVVFAVTAPTVRVPAALVSDVRSVPARQRAPRGVRHTLLRPPIG